MRARLDNLRIGNVWGRAIPEPRMLVQGLLPASAFGFVGPGGVSKTTLAIHLSIRTILGWDWWGFPVLTPGPVIFYSKEDEREIFASRVAKLGRAMGLSAGQQAQVADGLLVQEMTGAAAMQRLVEADRQGMMHFGELVGEVTETMRAAGAVLGWFDPGVYFGAGEQFLNTGEAALKQACRQIARDVAGAVGIIHHVGQAAAREKVADMYAGRGGSAFGDNARAMFAMHGVDTCDPLEMPGITEQEVLDRKVRSVNVGKVSYAEAPLERLFVRHNPGNWWDLELIRGANVRSRTPAQKAEAQASADADAVREFLLDEAAKGRTWTSRELRSATVPDKYGKKIGKDRVAAAVRQLLGGSELNVAEEPRKGGGSGKGRAVLVPIPAETSPAPSDAF